MDLTFTCMVLGNCSALLPLVGFAGNPANICSIYGLGKTIVLFIKITWLKQRLTSATVSEQREREAKVVSSL